jgi:hypothetical protein
MVLVADQFKNDKPISLDSPYNCLYSLFMAVWSTVLMEIWKRRQNEIAHMWNTSKTYLMDDVQRSEFKADYIIDTEYNKVKK